MRKIKEKKLVLQAWKLGKEYYNTKVIETVDFIEMWLYIDDGIMYNHGDKNNQDELDNFDYSSKENISKQDSKASTHYEKLKRLQKKELF